MFFSLPSVDLQLLSVVYRMCEIQICLLSVLKLDVDFVRKLLILRSSKM